MKRLVLSLTLLLAFAVADVQAIAPLNKTRECCWAPNCPKPKSITFEVFPGKVIAKPEPKYPLTGTFVPGTYKVKIQVVSDEVGDVVWAKVVSGPPLLRYPSMAAACQATFTPVKYRGRLVKVSHIIVYTFVFKPRSA